MYRKGKQGLDEIWVVGCGPSLSGFNWPFLADKTTIAVNGALLDVPSPDFFVTADSSFARKAANAHFWSIQTYKVLVMGSDHKHFHRLKNILHLFDHRIPPARFDGEIGFSESEFCTGQSSGFCGVQLAVILGAKRIHLLGFDFAGTGHGNYHRRYPSNPKAWDEFLVHFRRAATVLGTLGIELVSHSPTSRLNDTVIYEPLEAVHAQ